jgi:putative SOS response-associated peptidase YedK
MPHGVEGFYERESTVAGKQPYLIGMADGSSLALAAMGAMGESRGGGEIVQTFTVLTNEPDELCAPIHDRMPGGLGRNNWSAWLGEIEANQDELLGMLRPFPSHLMRAYPVYRRVGNVQEWAVADSRVPWRKNRWEMDRM